MKKNLKTSFLEELRKVPIIQVACEKSGISRQTFYRWKKESKTFSQDVDKSLREGISFVNDMSETQLLNLIKEKDYKSISFWLRHRHDAYKQKIEITTKEDSEELTPEQSKIVKQALKLASITKNSSIKKINKDK